MIMITLTQSGNNMKQIFLILMVLVSTPSMSDTLRVVSGLTSAQEAELALQAAQLVELNNKTPIVQVPKVDEVKKWAELVNAIGDGMVTIAAKTGMAVNEFANSKVGMFTMFIIGWNYLGHDLVGIVWGAIWLFVMLPGWLYCYRRMFIIEKITYYGKDSSGGKRKEVEYGDGSDIGDVTTSMYWIALAIITIVGMSAIR